MIEVIAGTLIGVGIAGLYFHFKNRNIAAAAEFHYKRHDTGHLTMWTRLEFKGIYHDDLPKFAQDLRRASELVEAYYNRDQDAVNKVKAKLGEEFFTK